MSTVDVSDCLPITLSMSLDSGPKLYAITDNADLLVHLAKSLGNPLTLLLSVMPRLNRSCREAAANALTTLMEVDLRSWNRLIDDAAVATIAARCPQLARLQLTNCTKITNGAVLALAARCPQLVTLSLSSCHKITDAAASYVALHCPMVTTLNLEGCYHLSDAAVGAVVGPSVGASVSTADSVSSEGAVVKSEVVAGGALTTQAPKLQDLAQFGSMNSGFIWHSP